MVRWVSFRHVRISLFSYNLGLTRRILISGGGNRLNKKLQSGDIPLLWMRHEAIMAGLHLKAADINWKVKDLGRRPKNSLGVWHILEQIPLTHLSYKDHNSVRRRFGFLQCLLYNLGFSDHADYFHQASPCQKSEDC